MGSRVDLLCEPDDGLEVDVGLLFLMKENELAGLAIDYARVGAEGDADDEQSEMIKKGTEKGVPGVQERLCFRTFGTEDGELEKRKEMKFWLPITPLSDRHVLPIESWPAAKASLSSSPTQMPSILSLLIHGLALLALLPALASAHMIEVPAGKKECFFEDLHVHDKVRPHTPHPFNMPHSSPDDGHVSSRRRRPIRYRLLGVHNFEHAPGAVV